MRVLVSGQSGFVGRHVVRCLHRRHCVVLDKLSEAPEAIIHLAWTGIPDYTNPAQYNNIAWQIAFLRRAVAHGITNITIAGTCLETVETLIPYSLAKLALRALAFELLPDIKWVRLWYLYGEGQSEESLLGRLRRAKRNNLKTLSVINGERDFREVTLAAKDICNVAMQTKKTGIFDSCSGEAEPVISFCRRMNQSGSIDFTLDYPTPYYEPYSFCGDPTRLQSI